MSAKIAGLFLCLIIFGNIVIRLPGLFEPASYGDECIYLTLGNAFNKGLVFYKDIHDNKPPLLYLIAALAQGKLFWLRLLTIAWNTVNVWLVYLLGRKLLHNPSAGLIASILFCIFSFLPEGRIANGEIFMIMPATLAVFLALTASKNKLWPWILCGFSFSLAFLFKIPIAFDFAGFMLAFFILSQNKIKDMFQAFLDKRIYLILLGFLLPIILSVAYYSYHGAFTPYVRSALMQNIGYLASWQGSNTGLYQRGLIVIIITLLIFLLRKRLGFAFLLLSTITLYGLFGVFLSERPYPHYLMEIAPWGALMITLLIWQRKISQTLITIILVGLTTLGVIKFKFWWYPQIPYYQNFYKYVTGAIDQNEYFRYFGGDKILNDYVVAAYLQKNSLTNDRVFIWGNGVCIYALSERIPPGRYTINYHIYDFNGFAETLTAITKQQPKFIIKLANESRQFNDLDNLINFSYKEDHQIGEAIIYRKL